MQDTKRALTKEQKQKLLRVFKEIDTDGNGRLSNPEIKRAAKKIGLKRLSNKDVDAIMKDADNNGNGCIEYKEFERTLGYHLMLAEDRDSQFRGYFNKFDKDKNVNELKTALKELGETMTDQEVQELFEEADKSKTGSISFEEFCECVFE